MNHIRAAADQAVAHVTGARRQAYGEPIENHTRTALLWTAQLKARGHDIEVTPELVCELNILQKMARAIHGGWDGDTPIDVIGFTLNLVDLEHVQNHSYSRIVSPVVDAISDYHVE